MKQITLFFVTTLLATSVVAKETAPAQKGPTPEAKALIKAQMEKAQHVEVGDLKKELDGGKKLIILDVRQKSERPIMGAIRKDDTHIPRGFIEIKAYGILADREANIVAYCGKGIRSAFVANTLNEMGYKNVRSMKGGMKAWNEAGFDRVEIAK